MGSVALHGRTELDTKGFQEGLMLASPTLRCGSDRSSSLLGEGPVLNQPRVPGRLTPSHQTVKLSQPPNGDQDAGEPGLSQGMALRNAWKHRLTAVQSGIAEADVTVNIAKVSPPQMTI
jgi:hypothetical protein